MADAWHEVATTDAVTDDQPLGVKAGGKEIGLFRVDGKVYAIEDVCPHAYALLSSGFVDGDTIECPLHQGRFHIATGKAVAAPCTEDIRAYAVKIEGGAVLLKE